MAQSSNHRLYGLWLVLCSILLLSLVGSPNVRVALVRNCWQLRFWRALQRDENLAEFEGHISRLAGSVHKDGSINRVAGVYYLIAGDNQRALEYLLLAHQRQPDNQITSYWLGKCYDQSGKYGKALLAMYEAGNHDYFPVIATNDELRTVAQDLIDKPISAHARFELAKRVYDWDQDLGRQYFELAFQTSPGVLHYSLDAAWFFYGRGDFETANVFGERALLLFPGEVWVWTYWGAWNRAMGNTDQAIQDLERVVDRFPTGAAANTAHIELSKICIERRDYRAAIEHLEAVTAIKGEQLSVYLLRAEAYAGLEQCPAAQEQLMRASAWVQTDRQEAIYAQFEKTVQKSCP